MDADLSVSIAGQRFKNPVLTASGTFGYGLEFLPYFDISRLGGFCTKGLSRHPRQGNAPGRILETPSGMLNAIGLENVGVDAFISDKLPALRGHDTRIVANVLGVTVDEFVEITELLNPEAQVSCLELNISCPNIKEGGVEFGHDPELTFKVVEAVKKASSKPVWVKLSPNVTDITVFARACQDAGADAITLVNTFVGMSIHVREKRPMLSNTVGGLSGPSIRPLALRLTWQCAQAVDIPVVGIGGIST
ncbi:MAG TPA: dihydroorotate dehydrogenase, partial [Acidobacteriota bacterium]|nr:dihydroorotate dehydrogenase [Acidobacteriota bacterium]